MLTLFALCAGLYQHPLRAWMQRWEHAVLAILFAAVFDALDGRIARLLDSSTKFGAELDSLSDFVSFGVAPAVVLFMWTMQDVKGIGWALHAAVQRRHGAPPRALQHQARQCRPSGLAQPLLHRRAGAGRRRPGAAAADRLARVWHRNSSMPVTRRPGHAVVAGLRSAASRLSPSSG